MTEINIEKLVRNLINTFLSAGEISINLRKSNEVAEIATGAITKTANGLLSPPVKKSSKSN